MHVCTFCVFPLVTPVTARLRDETKLAGEASYAGFQIYLTNETVVGHSPPGVNTIFLEKGKILTPRAARLPQICRRHYRPQLLVNFFFDSASDSADVISIDGSGLSAASATSRRARRSRPTIMVPFSWSGVHAGLRQTVWNKDSPAKACGSHRP
jgi:hypothetical protein